MSSLEPSGTKLKLLILVCMLSFSPWFWCPQSDSYGVKECDSVCHGTLDEVSVKGITSLLEKLRHMLDCWAKHVELIKLAGVTQHPQTHHPHFCVLRPSSWMNPNFRILGPLLELSSMGRLPGEQEPNEKKASCPCTVHSWWCVCGCWFMVALIFFCTPWLETLCLLLHLSGPIFCSKDLEALQFLLFW